MSEWLLGIAVFLLVVAIAIQVLYLRALKRAGIEITRTTRIVSFANIGLLVLVAAGLVFFYLNGAELAMNWGS